MKKIFTILFLCLFSLSSIFSLEFNTLVNENSAFTILKDKVFLDQSESLSMSLRASMNQDGTNYFITEAYFEHEFNKIFNEDKKYYNQFILNLPLFKFNFQFDHNQSTKSILSLGRFGIKDLTEFIINQENDGIFYQFNSDPFNFSVYAGCTALINENVVSAIASDGSISNAKYSLYDLSSPYITALMNFSLPELFINQSLAFESIYIMNLNNMNDDSRLYASLALNGPFSDFLFYNASSTLCFTNFDKISNLSKLDLTCLFDLLNSSIGFNVLYASGKNGSLEPFYGFTKENITYTRDDKLVSSIMKYGISASILPINNLYVGLSYDLIYDFANSYSYLGNQMAINLNYQIFTDLQVNGKLTTYNGKNENANNTEIVISVLLAL